MNSRLMYGMMKVIKVATPFYVGGENIFELLEKRKKAIVIFGHPQCTGCVDIMPKFPSLFFRGWKKRFKIRFCNMAENKQECIKLGIDQLPAMIIKNNRKPRIVSGKNDILREIRKL